MHAFWCIMLYIYTHTRPPKKNDYLFALVYMVGWKGGATCIYIYIYDHICIYTYMIYVTWNVCVGSLRDFSPIVSSHSIMGEFPRLTSYSWVPPEAWVSMRWVIILSMCAFVEQKQSKHMCTYSDQVISCVQLCTYTWFPHGLPSKRYQENTANDAGEKFSTVQTVWEGSPSTTWPKLQSGWALPEIRNHLQGSNKLSQKFGDPSPFFLVIYYIILL